MTCTTHTGHCQLLKTHPNTSTVPVSMLAFSASLETCLQDGEVSGEEFKQAVKNACVGKNFDEFPNAFRVFIVNQFKTVDVNGMCDRVVVFPVFLCKMFYDCDFLVYHFHNFHFQSAYFQVSDQKHSPRLLISKHTLLIQFSLRFFIRRVHTGFCHGL